MTANMTAARIIIVDWGTTAFRAWLLESVDGTVLDAIPEGRGMRELAGSSFRDYCAARLAPWLTQVPRPPVYLAGMVGAASGWTEAPQPALPVDAATLAGVIISAPGLDNAWILPGARVDTSEPDRVDVMRGEETQVLGALALTGQRDALICLPGTHSKWARVRDGALEDFTTFMTGELHGALLAHTILGLDCPPRNGNAPPGPAFDQGLAEAERDGGLLSHAFATRTRRLYRGLDAGAVSDFLSGLLIGEELADARGRGYLPAAEVLLVGAPVLAERYAHALETRGIIARMLPPEDAIQRGVLDLVRSHADTLI